MTWLWPSLLGLSCIVQPDTILRWHRAGFRAYWRWKSRGRPGINSKPRVPRHREPEQLLSTVAHHEKRKQTLECQRRTHAEIDPVSDVAQLTTNSGPPRSTCSTVALTAGSDTPTANDRRNLLIAQRQLSLVRKGQFPFNDALEEGLEFSGCHGHLEPNRIVAIGSPGVGHNLG